MSDRLFNPWPTVIAGVAPGITVVSLAAAATFVGGFWKDLALLTTPVAGALFALLFTYALRSRTPTGVRRVTVFLRAAFVGILATIPQLLGRIIIMAINLPVVAVPIFAACHAITAVWLAWILGGIVELRISWSALARIFLFFFCLAAAAHESLRYIGRTTEVCMESLTASLYLPLAFIARYEDASAMLRIPLTPWWRPVEQPLSETVH